MALQLKNNNRRLKLASISGGALLGAIFIVLQTFPHLKSSLYINFVEKIIGRERRRRIGHNDSHDVQVGSTTSTKDISSPSSPTPTSNSESREVIPQNKLNKVSREQGHRGLLSAMAIYPFLSILKRNLVNSYDFLLNLSVFHFFSRLLLVIQDLISKK